MEMTASEMMALKPVQARLLFPGDAAAVAARFRTLAKTWHPDRAPGADPAVFAQIAALHAVAKSLVEGGAVPDRIIRAADGRVFRFGAATCHVGDVGEILVGRTHVVHLVPPDLADLAERAARLRPRFADDAMRGEMERFLPRRRLDFATADGGHAFVEEKTQDQVLLRDLLKLAPFEPRHAAWMTTRLLNIACWLEWAGFAHGAIGPDTLLVSPSSHGVSLTGPFLCARGFGRRIEVLPERTIDACPRYGAGSEADLRLDPALVRLTIRECAGDPAGMRLRADPDFPKLFADWLTLPSVGGAQADFPAWEQARDASFGPRRFVEWDVDPSALMAA